MAQIRGGAGQIPRAVSGGTGGWLRVCDAKTQGGGYGVLERPVRAWEQSVPARQGPACMTLFGTHPDRGAYHRSGTDDPNGEDPTTGDLQATASCDVLDQEAASS